MAKTIDVVGVDEAKRIADAYFEAERMIIERIAKHIAKGIDAPQWEIDSLARAQALRTETAKIVTDLTRASSTYLQQQAASMYERGSAKALSEIGKDVGHAAAGSLTKRAAVQRVTAELTSKTSGLQSAILRKSDDVYRSVIGNITRTAAARGISRKEAAKVAMSQLADAGIGTFTDAGGRNWALGSYVDMATRTGLAKAQNAGHVDTLKANDLDLVYVQPGPRACETCDEWASKILAIEGAAGEIETTDLLTGETITVEVDATLEEAEDDGFAHPNCRCSLSAYLPGVTDASQIERPPWDEEGYKAQQEQRAIERDIRDAKMDAAASIDDASRAAAEADVRDAQAAMREHLDQHPDLKRQSDRESITGRFGESPASRLDDVVPDPPSSALDFSDDALATLDDVPKSVEFDDLPLDQEKALAGYTHGNDEVLNGALRNETASGWIQDDIDKITDAMTPLDSDILVERTLGNQPEVVTKLFGVEGDDLQAVIGHSLDERGFSSTSFNAPDYNSGTAARGEFAQNHQIVMRVQVPKGTNAVNVRNISDYTLENELVLQPGMRYTVVGTGTSTNNAGLVQTLLHVIAAPL